ncbi:MAG: CapA family protein [Gleimia sp.]|jgi:poly-gamma-glutamate capsule biosynthesis protein CapA/YwtB (metallophosphatase superfamily)|nr:CapA family protein [Acidobacteriota bacterium]
MKPSKLTILIATAAAFALPLSACSSSTDEGADGTPVDVQVTDPAASEEVTEATEPEPDVTFTVVGTGDVLSHMPVVEHSIQADGTYDYAPLVADIKPFIEGADLALCHQEVPLTYDEASASGYPVFAAPAGWARSTKELGYDGCSTASNHSWDRGWGGVEDTIDILTEQGLGFTGTSRAGDQDPIQYYTITKDGRDIKVAHLSFTYGLNYEVVPEIDENPWLVNRDDPDHMIELAKQARDEGADVVIVSSHGGVEYQAEPSDRQIEWAEAFAQSGVIDLYLGHHVHVPQPIEKFEGGVDGQGMWAFFGTGNLVSNMHPEMGYGTQNGYIAHATITVPAEGSAHVDSAKYTGVVLDDLTNQVFIASSYEQANHPGSMLTDADAQLFYDHLKSVMGDAEELTEAPGTIADPVKVIPRAFG